MNNIFLRRAFVVGALLSAASLAPRAQAQVVISQVYGGGGSMSSNPVPAFKYDYVELFNNGSTAVDLSSYSLQYASAAGLFPTTGNNLFTFASGATIGADSYFLVRFGLPSTYTGADIPNYDASGLASLSATAGKVALANTTSQVTFTAPNTFTSGNVVDFVGYGTTASAYEGLGAAPAPSTTTADFRSSVAGLFVDTNNNNVDFTLGTPTPHYSGGLAAAPEPSGTASILVGAALVGGLLCMARRRTAGHVQAA